MKNTKPFFILILVFGISFSGFSQVLQFEKTIPSEADYVSSFIELSENEFLLLGALKDSIDSDTINQHFYHPIIYKINSSADTIFSSVFLSPNGETNYCDIAIKTPDENILLMGMTAGHLCLLKINQEGIPIWSKNLEVPINSPGNIKKAVLLPTGGILLLCSGYRNEFLLTSAKSLLVSIDEEGNLNWFNETIDQSIRDIAVISQNEIIALFDKYNPTFYYYDPHKIYQDLPPLSNNFIGFQIINFDGNIIKETIYPFVATSASSIALNHFGDYYLTGSGSWPNPPNYNTYISGGFIMKSNWNGANQWSRFYPWSGIQKIDLLNNRNLLTLSWPYLRTLNSDGDSINGYKFNNSYHYDKMPLTLISGNYLYQTARPSGSNQINISKINLDLIADGIPEHTGTFSKALSVYPNPAQNSLCINLENAREPDGVISLYSDEFRVFIYNIKGQKIKETPHQLINNKLIVSLNGIEGGLYFFRINMSGKELISEKVVISN